MKRLSVLTLIAGCLLAVGIFVAADHIDAPAVTGAPTDITDLHVFRSPDNADNLVFSASIQGLLDPSATAGATFDPNTILEFKIDNDGDLIEDLVIQAVYRDDELWVYGPAAPQMTGTSSKINVDANLVKADITNYGQSAIVGQGSGMKIFAGPRDDPFFFDFTQYNAILSGNASGFNDPGTDTFAGTNVLSTVVEVPKSMLGNASTLNVWVTTSRRQ